MPLPDVTETEFEREFAEFVRQPFDPKELQLETAIKLIESLQPLDENLLRLVLRASRFIPSEGPAFLTSKIRAEVQRRLDFTERMQRFIDRQMMDR